MKLFDNGNRGYMCYIPSFVFSFPISHKNENQGCNFVTEVIKLNQKAHDHENDILIKICIFMILALILSINNNQIKYNRSRYIF